VPLAPKSRELSKHETREALLDAGLQEFAVHGLDGPSLDAICTRAGFTRGAFYVHFHGRDDFVVAVMERVFGRFLDAVIGAADGTPDLLTTMDRFAAVVTAAPPGRPSPLIGLAFHKVLDACGRSSMLRTRFVELLEAGVARIEQAIRHGQEAGTVRADVDAGPTARLMVLLALGVLTAADLGVALMPDALQGVATRLVVRESTSRTSPAARTRRSRA